MKIGMVTDGLGHLKLDEFLPAAAEAGVEMLEFACGNWSTAPHLNLNEMVESERARREFIAKVRDHGLAISALNCSGNQLAPGEAGKAHESVVRKTFQLANLMGINRVVMMSGLPAGPGDTHPNWIIVAWPPEASQLLNWQWDEVAIPYWRDLAAYGRNLGIDRICIELHGHQLVYNTETLLKLREAVGETVGANFDPSHMMWMGGEPLTAIRQLGEAIFYVHAKDTRIDRANSNPNGLLETKPNARVMERAWNYVTLGYGHGESWWRDFVTLLAQVGYDDVLSIEHEDMSMSPLEGVRKSVEFLERIIIREMP
ncbi:MAG: sugar phosphate isomerase/epimerase [Anaerolineaceae bacterium]|nr:sugar phosphate isomerase/epimerase [Anaerolineaceae bacterium]